MLLVSLLLACFKLTCHEVDFYFSVVRFAVVMESQQVYHVISADISSVCIWKAVFVVWETSQKTRAVVVMSV